MRRTCSGRASRTPQEDAAQWSRLSEQARASVPAPPDRKAPFQERLGRRGATFTMAELVDHLLQPLGELHQRPARERLSAYTVVRFDDSVDFASRSVRLAMGPLLAALAQIEESEHSGAVPDDIGVANAILNRRHWAAVGMLGAAHLVANQPPVGDPPQPVAFDSAKVPRAMLKYFVPYLVSLLQTLVLRRIVADAGTVVAASDKDAEAKLTELRSDLLQLAVNGHFTQVSIREVLHRYYRLCQKGLDVRMFLGDARRAISHLHDKLLAARQIQVATEVANSAAATAKHLEVVSHTQVMVEYIEIILASAYAINLWKAGLRWLRHMGWVAEPHTATWLSTFLHGCGDVLAAITGGVAAWLLLRPGRLRRKRQQATAASEQSLHGSPTP